MQPQVRAPLVAAAMALGLAGLAFVLLDRPETGPPLPEEEQQPSVRASSASSERAGDDDDDHHDEHAAAAPHARAERRRHPDEQERAAAATTAQRPAALDVEPWEDDAEVRAQLLEDAVVTVLTSVAPELGDVVLERSCDAKGDLCVFEGPWPGDDFLRRWIAATGEGRFAPEDMNGVTFEKFERIEHADGLRYSITAVAP